MSAIETACREMFALHQRSAFGGRFHVPDATRYPALFAWDSGYHALSTRHLDLALAQEELRTLYSANTLPDGLLSHERRLSGPEGRLEEVVALFGPMFTEDRSLFVDPPTAAYAAARVAMQSGAGADDLLDAAIIHLRALRERRVPPGFALPLILHPFESGTEGSPVFASLAPMEQIEQALALLRDLTFSAVAARMDPARALESGHRFVVADPTFCSWYLLALEELAEACHQRQRLDDERWLRTQAEATAQALVEHLWWEGESIFGGYDATAGRRLDAITAAGLIAAASRLLHEAGYTTRVVRRHLVAGASPLCGPHGLAFGQVVPGAPLQPYVQWHGNAVWGATAYWGHLALLRAGDLEAAATLREQLTQLITRHGFREFYDAWSGDAGGAGAEMGFTWPALVLEMAAAEQEARSSHS